MPKHLFAFLPCMIGIVLLAQLYSCKEEENLPPLEIHSIDPPQAEIGDTIRIIGQGFSPGFAYNQILFAGGANTYALQGSNTQMLLVEIPDGALPGAMTVDILEVENAQTPTLETLPPVISEISPAEAWIGDTIVIRGQHFQRNKARNHVQFGGSNWTTVVSATRTELKVIVPQDALNGPVSIMGFEGGSFKIKPSVVEAFVPDHAVVGDTIVIKGRGLVASQVVFRPSVIARLPADKSDSRNIYAVVPPGAVDGTLRIVCRVNNQDINIETPKPFIIYPSIRELSPLSGSAGVPVTISGYNFSPVAAENIVTFNGTLATVTSASATELVVSVPAGFSTGPVSVSVSGKITTGPVFSIAEPGAPIIYSVSPRSGPVGSRVLITGTDFGSTAASNTVKFGGNVTANVVTASATRLVVDVPAGAQTGQITVIKEGKTGVGSTFTVTTDAVPFISSIEPASASRNAEIIIKGGNFNKDAKDFSVFNNGSKPFISFSSITADQIVARVPANYELGNHTLFVLQDSKVSNGVAFQVTGTPAITSLNVTDGIPGSVVTITGIDFHPVESNNVVKFGDTQAVLVNPGDNQDDGKVTAYVPDIAAGVYSITVTAFGHQSGGINFTVTALAVPVRNIIYAEFSETTPPTFRLNRRTSNPPSQTTLHSFVTIAPMNVVSLDPPRSRAFYTDADAFDILRVNLDGTGQTVVYDDASYNYFPIYDLTLDTQREKIYFCDGPDGGTLFAGNMDGTMTPEWLADYTTLPDGLVPLGLTYIPENDLLYICGRAGANVAEVITMTTDGASTSTLFSKTNDGLVSPQDVKIDVSTQKIFILDDQRMIKVGNLDGSGGLTTLVTRTRDIIGMAIDIEAQYVYWMEYATADSKKASVFRMTYDHTEIPGTSPAVREQEVYTNILTVGNPYMGVTGLALDMGNDSGSSQRGALSFSSIKLRRQIDPHKIINRPMKKARPGQ